MHENSVMRCIHARPASHLGPPAAGQDSGNGVAARRAHAPPRRARARGSRRGHIGAGSRARARQQIKISQNWGTPVPFCSENGWVGVQNFKFSGYMTVSGLCMHFARALARPGKFLLFTEIPTEKMLQMQGWVETIWIQGGWLVD